MSVAVKSVSNARSVLGPTGNRVRCEPTEPKQREGPKPKESQQKQKPSRVTQIPKTVVRSNVSVDSCCSSDSSSSSCSATKLMTSKRKVKSSVKVVPDGVETEMMSPSRVVPVKRCGWITPFSDPIYTSFHDEEWGVPVYDDRKLFELFVLSQAFAELTWPAILNNRDIFRKLFDNFDPASVANFNEKKFSSGNTNGNALLSEPKLRAIVENAKQVLKVQGEFGSFSNYFWSFVNNQPIENRFRYARQVPAKTPKAEFISKDLMKRGFRCVGPTFVYSFMQVAGIVNNHLLTCFRYEGCNLNNKMDMKPRIESTEKLTEVSKNTHPCHD
ncbi:Methyladenine glycosylase [Dillenia turbinata]|uniref:Methyladenine glycosylase n=1 Tax=Dillenia turbinata TaxID=194707 RepID=A0AAN8ZMJ3_9MAGN